MFLGGARAGPAAAYTLQAAAAALATRLSLSLFSVGNTFAAKFHQTVFSLSLSLSLHATTVAA